ncbi:hypothetical protein BKH46_05380 [Helicobacter sp. 12S02634-8]|uniref:hypothetical protein n=1 Tax=Helicobacter sp. 12S02634-8 TaxID=1476199 RepID=UPI000BA7606A|nr:hypothetical protein [Helicobacter sp. 12S02634-8]PAF47140.1 hypothetical protein BKH46_05380 [Helicobacter sp. 12S02634-8]
MRFKILFFGIVCSVLFLGAYDFQTWKNPPPALLPQPFPHIELRQEASNEASNTQTIAPFLFPFDFFPLGQTLDSQALLPSNNAAHPPLGLLLGPPQILPQVLPNAWELPSGFWEKDGIAKKEFLISYRLYVQDGIAKGDSYGISEPIRSYVDSGRYVLDYVCRIDTHIGDILGDDNAKGALKMILEKEKDKVLLCLYKSGVRINDDTASNGTQIQTKTLLSLPARAVETYLDNSFLILEVYKEKR